MKEIAKVEQDVGGGKVKAAVGVEASNLKLEVSAFYPIEKVIEPATQAVDKALDSLEKAIPGDWDKALIEQFKVQFKNELVKLLSE